MSEAWAEVAAWLESLDVDARALPDGLPDDVRERLEAHATAHAALKRKQAELDNFVYVASHDLGEPLRTVTQFSQLLERRYGDQLDDKAKRYLHFINDGSARMRGMLRGLLEFSRVGRAELEPETVDLQALFEREAARGGQGTGSVEVSDIPPVTGTSALLEKVTAHLVQNGRVFRHVEQPFAVRVSAAREGEMVRVEVESEGPQVAADLAEDAFKLFRKLHDRENYPGAGMGLAIVRRVVERHGGETGLTPSEGRTVAWFTLPAA